MTQDIQSRLTALGIELPDAPSAIANYVPWQLCGGMLYVSGQISRDGHGHVPSGQLGSAISIQEGQTAARWCALNILAQAQSALGHLDRIAQSFASQGSSRPRPNLSITRKFSTERQIFSWRFWATRDGTRARPLVLQACRWALLWK